MKFTLEKKALAGLFRALGKGKSGSLLRLAAQDGQIIFRQGEEEAGCEGQVVEEGVCFFRPTQFLALLRAHAGEKNLTVEVTSDGIQVGSTKISRGLWEVSLFMDPHTAPETLIFSRPKEQAPSTIQEEFNLE